MGRIFMPDGRASQDRRDGQAGQDRQDGQDNHDKQGGQDRQNGQVTDLQSSGAGNEPRHG
jgi:hypothetical protein